MPGAAGGDRACFPATLHTLMGRAYLLERICPSPNPQSPISSAHSRRLLFSLTRCFISLCNLGIMIITVPCEVAEEIKKVMHKEQEVEPRTL